MIEEEVPETNQAPAETNPSAKKARTSKQLNKFDPIMFTPIRKRHTWKFVRPNGERAVPFYNLLLTSHLSKIFFLAL